MICQGNRGNPFHGLPIEVMDTTKINDSLSLCPPSLRFLTLLGCQAVREQVANKTYNLDLPRRFFLRKKIKNGFGQICRKKKRPWPHIYLMSDVTDQHLTRARSWAENQCVPPAGPRGDDAAPRMTSWADQCHCEYIAGSRSLNEEDLRKNLKFFQVPDTSIETIGSKLTMRIFDEYANILRCMYIRSLESGHPDKFRKRATGNKDLEEEHTSKLII
jgi:hypothetical protein